MTRRRYFVVLALIAAVAAGLRLPGLTMDFWIDEIWSWAGVRGVKAAFDLVARVHNDNNHILNSLILYAWGDGRWPPLYRLHSLLAGVGTVVLGGWTTKTEDRPRALMAAGLIAASYWMILYSTEARGYALAGLAAVAAFQLQEQWLEKPSAARAAAFTVAVVVGLLSHLTFIFVYAGLLAASTYRLGLRRSASLHWAGLGFLTWLYLIHIRRLTIYGGAPISPGFAAAELLRSAVGFPDSWGGRAAAIAAAAAAGIAGFRALPASRTDWKIFYVVSILVAPCALVAAAPNTFYYPRYFLLCLLFILSLASDAAAAALRRPGGSRALALTALAAYAVGNAGRLVSFYSHGRGDYSSAMREISRRTPEATITVGSDHDNAHRAMLLFYSRLLAPHQRIVYFEQRSWNRREPRWVILHDQAARPAPAAGFATAAGAQYRLTGTYPYDANSGWNWYLYELTSN